MRGSKAKHLRRQAEAETMGRPEREYRVIRHAVREYIGPGGIETRYVNCDQIVLNPRCTRAVYQERKRAA